MPTLLLLSAALAQELLVPEPVPWVISDEAHQSWLEAGAALSGPEDLHLQLYAEGPDGEVRPLEAYLPKLPPSPDKDEGAAGPPVDNPGEGQGALSGKAVYLSQCHGWIWYDSLGRFSTQRGNLFDTVEDFHNPEGANLYLTRYLENAGARVFTARERDMNPEMAIADNDGAGYSERGSGFADGARGFADEAPWGYGEGPFSAGTTRSFPADGGGVATWVPEVPSDGEYAVYVSWDSDAANASDAHYRITHPGGVIDRWFDQTVHGSTWQYVETLWLPAGLGGVTVELIGDSTQSGRYLSADAVRVGGGSTDVTRHGANPDRPRWEAGAIQYTQFNGAPTSVYDPSGDGNGSDPSSRSRWAAWEHPSGEDAVYLSWHSNAGGGTGTSTYTYEGSNGPAVSGSVELAGFVHDEVVEATTTLWDAGWYDRGLHTAAFSEVNPYNNDELPSALLELAFHDHEVDVELLKDPAYRRDASRAMYRGITRYFAWADGVAPVFLPEPPEALTVRHEGGQLVAHWADGPVGAPYGDAAEGYVVYRSADGRSWDGGEEVSGRSLTLSDATPGEALFIRVTAINGGGESFPTEVMGGQRCADDAPPVLLVSAFDRLQVSLLPWEDVPVVGDVRRMPPGRVNPFDLVAWQGRALGAAGWGFDAVADEALGQVNLSDYRVVIWAAGEESTLDESISSTQQAALRAFVEGGGKLWVSGSEVLWDLDYRGGASDQAFAAEVLGAGMFSDDSGSELVTGEGLLAGLALDFGEADGAPYPVEYPDVLDTSREVLARYGSGGVAAAMGEGVVVFGFPFDCVGDEATRAEVAGRILAELVPEYAVEDCVSPTDTGGDSGGGGDSGAADDTGLVDDTGVPGEDGGKGCGCGSTRAGGAGWVLVAMVGALARRRRAAG